MSTPDYSGPAFPQNCEQRCSQHYHYSDAGMSMRDWFAGQAINGVIALQIEAIKSGMPVGDMPTQVATQVYKLADAMLSERNKNK